MARGIGDELSIGERIAIYRARRGMTQAVLANLVGRSEDWLSKIERGDRPIRQLDMLVDIARVLRVNLGDLIGQPVLAEDSRQQDDVPAVRDALMAPRRLSRALFPAGEGEHPDLDRVTALTRYAWDDYQEGRLGPVVAALPGLIESSQQLEDAAADSTERRRQTLWVSARVHHLAATTLMKFGEVDLAWIAAERAMRAGDDSADPLILASAARAATHAMLARGRYDDAVQLGTAAAAYLESDADERDEVALSLSGMLYLRIAIAAARRNDRDGADELLRRAKDAGDRLGYDANLWHTGFGPTNVTIHRLSAALDLGDVAFVLKHGPRVSVAHMPSERAATFHLDMARAYYRAGRTDDALAQLLEAEATAAPMVRHSVVVREIVRDLHRRTHGTSRALTALARRCRAIA
jgi:transcriptional regulator with XRE-family HTH domain